MIIKKARLKTAVSMSRGSTALIATSSSASLAAIAVLLISASAFSLFSALFTAVATPPPSSVNTVMYDPVWSFEEELRESLISETVTLRSSICSFSPAAHSSPAQNAAELSLQSLMISSSSLCEKASVQSLTDITTCLHCIKQLKKKRILYIEAYSETALSQSIAYRASNRKCEKQNELISILMLKDAVLVSDSDIQSDHQSVNEMQY
ncbi:hypothetical protein BDDG_02287 [Blastomyces dermatitidis ATCC 18188]|uniref:Uncharacterized protein n=1 Tax=Ajellomyces dermatitidis (strain ATCC 18188 / CBS 674.68) TaxID=653446 RepID=F2T7Y5_AJEDA|nr:hypothetical protein BDDG_02287 [Blastomyces dermatitidis ATCC 18188]